MYSLLLRRKSNANIIPPPCFFLLVEVTVEVEEEEVDAEESYRLLFELAVSNEVFSLFFIDSSSSPSPASICFAGFVSGNSVTIYKTDAILIIAAAANAAFLVKNPDTNGPNVSPKNITPLTSPKAPEREERELQSDT